MGPQRPSLKRIGRPGVHRLACCVLSVLSRNDSRGSTVAHCGKTVTAIAGRLANVKFRTALGAALVPRPQRQRVAGLGFRFGLPLHGLELVHAAAVRLLLGTLGMNSAAGIARGAANRANRSSDRWRGLHQGQGAAVARHFRGSDCWGKPAHPGPVFGTSILPRDALNVFAVRTLKSHKSREVRAITCG
jgi:hypothetical protein